VTGEGAGRERIAALVDTGSFVELDRAENGTAAVVGVGTIGGRDVALYAMDVAALNETAAAKVVKVQELALRSRVPLVCLHDGGEGAPPEELAALAGFAAILAGHVRASGVVPQLSVAPAPAGLHPAALTDFVLDPGDVRPLLSHLPAHSGETPPFAPSADPPERGDRELQAIAAGSYDVREVVERLLDDRALLQVLPERGRGLLTGFGRLCGHPTGVVANRGVIDAEAAAKAARFVRFCDAFNVPLLSVVDVPRQAASGREHAWLLAAYGEATVPKLAVIVGQAAGEGYLLMSPRQLGADLSLAWPTAAVGAGDPYAAAERGYVDDVVEPRETRRTLVRGLELCLRKAVEPAPRKHGNLPL
jgi:propionyl-CoA carboxylase beta chain